jgi:hypothetical protein
MPRVLPGDVASGRRQRGYSQARGRQIQSAAGIGMECLVNKREIYHRAGSG